MQRRNRIGMLAGDHARAHVFGACAANHRRHHRHRDRYDRRHSDRSLGAGRLSGNQSDTYGCGRCARRLSARRVAHLCVDIRHNFNVGGSYAIPGASIGGGPLQVGTVFTALSGRPLTPGVGTFDESGQNIGALRADCLADPIYNYDLDYLFPTRARPARRS